MLRLEFDAAGVPAGGRAVVCEVAGAVKQVGKDAAGRAHLRLCLLQLGLLRLGAPPPPAHTRALRRPRGRAPASSRGAAMSTAAK